MRALARRAKPHDCAVWLGREPDEKYAPSPFDTIWLRASTEQPVFLANSTDGKTCSTPYIYEYVWMFYFCMMREACD